jgi:hypothetical protein
MRDSNEDAVFAGDWAAAATHIRSLVMLSTIQAQASWIQHFPDMSAINKSPTMCGKAQVVLDAYSGKQVLTTVLNPNFSYFDSSSGSQYILQTVNVSELPQFEIVRELVQLCPKIAGNSICGAAKTVAASLINSEDVLPLRPAVSRTRLLHNVNR